MENLPFRNRTEAGTRLARKLSKFADRPNVIVLALPRGGVPVAYEVARELRVPLDVFLVRKLGVPGQEELGLGAIASGGVKVINQELVQYLRIPDSVIDRVAAEEQRELERREREYSVRGTRRDIQNRTVILVNDGLATGFTMRAASGCIPIIMA